MRPRLAGEAGWMVLTDDDRSAELTDLLTGQDGVLRVESAMKYLTRDVLRWRVSSGRWQLPCRGIVVAQSGPLTEIQVLRIAALWAGPGAALAGLTAATLDGLRGFADGGHRADRPIHVLIPACCPVRRVRPCLPLVVHYSRLLGEEDIHPLRQPPRTRIARSAVDAAAWMATDRGAQAVLAAAVQQRLVRVEDLATVVARNQRLPRRGLISNTLDDIAGGAQALSELDFTRLLRRHRLPEPDRQAQRLDSTGRRRWLDAAWEAARLIVEVDGIHHLDAAQYWADMDRDNDFTLSGYRVLRFPAFAVRYSPGLIARQIRDALAAARQPGLATERSPGRMGPWRDPPGKDQRIREAIAPVEAISRSWPGRSG
jgi:very-short-patch-repair endonuclease